MLLIVGIVFIIYAIWAFFFYHPDDTKGFNGWWNGDSAKAAEIKRIKASNKIRRDSE